MHLATLATLFFLLLVLTEGSAGARKESVEENEASSVGYLR
jgi:hypothetical protein